MGGFDIWVKGLSLSEGAVEYVTLRVHSSFISRDLAQFNQATD
jgi:hypothetical protein